MRRLPWSSPSPIRVPARRASRPSSCPPTRRATSSRGSRKRSASTRRTRRRSCSRTAASRPTNLLGGKAGLPHRPLQPRGGRIGIAAQAVGMARAAFEAALHLRQRARVLRQALFEHQAVNFRLADMATQRRGARQLVWHAASAEGCRPALPEGGLDGQAVRLRDGREGLLRRDPDPRRLRLRQRLSRSSASTATCGSARSTRARRTSSASSLVVPSLPRKVHGRVHTSLLRPVRQCLQAGIDARAVGCRLGAALRGLSSRAKRRRRSTAR
jgi:hypothetical protein